ncbi:MAG TPA: DUF1570 domain-containing protein [Phycisphaerales bacterium]|nr:DUF1570 domain-containing protein [Phycisphaerales bacterium]
MVCLAAISPHAQAESGMGAACCQTIASEPGSRPHKDREHLLLRAAADRAAADSNFDEADALYREILRLDPFNAEAFAALEAVSAARPLSRDSWAYQQARAALPNGGARFVEHETRRFIVISDAGAAWTQNQAEHLERAWHQFHRFAKRLNLQPLPLRHKLVCILFDRREDYQRFAAEQDGVADLWIAGYYSPRFDRIVFYNVESDPAMTRARSKLDSMQEQVAKLARDARRAANEGNRTQADWLRQNLARYEQHLHREMNRVDNHARTVSIATTVHEAIHQIAFHTRVQSPHIQYPLWISEGLATAFETDSPNHAFGPDHDFAPRREMFLKLLSEDAVIPLRDLIAMTNLAGATDETVTAMYHQGYALVSWMSRFRRVPLQNYLSSMLLEPAGNVSQERHVELFQAAFGDIAQLERAWLRHELASLPDPATARHARRMIAIDDVPLPWTPAEPTHAGIIHLLASHGD